MNSAEYHEKTSYRRYGLKGHFLDFKNRPDVFKTYPHTELYRLPEINESKARDFSNLIRKDRAHKEKALTLDIVKLSRILLLTGGITARARHPDGDFYYRSIPSAGALYPAEIYLAANGIHGLKDGLYHFSIAQHALAVLRRGIFPIDLKETSTSSNHKNPLITFFLSAIFFRSAWKYRDRSYRYHLLDTGHLLENLLMALESSGCEAVLSYDFADSEINHLLGLDETKEACLCLCHVQGKGAFQEEVTQKIEELPEPFKITSRVAKEETDYPLVREMHTAGSAVTSPKDPEHGMLSEIGPQPENWKKIRTPASWPEVISYPENVLRRRSSRNFVKAPITKEALAALFGSLCARSSGKSEEASKISNTLCVGFLIGNAGGSAPGFYLLDMRSQSIGMAASGTFTGHMAHTCLDQAWLSGAAVHFLFMSNLNKLDQRWGPRGYRYAMMTAGRLGQNLYLATTAMGLGCCGIGAFYDTEAADLLGLNRETRLLYLVAAGPVKSLINR